MICYMHNVHLVHTNFQCFCVHQFKDTVDQEVTQNVYIPIHTCKTVYNALHICIQHWVNVCAWNTVLVK